ncbi:MAG: glycosyl transferase family 2 [Mucilaginibacter sp.]|nr:glycosyl transferase family 2 [Mucilaginibacter sp.]
MELAIVIPVYKKQYLEATLLSVSNQSDKNFSVYIGDDNSPDDIYGVVKQFEEDLKISYKKFNHNLGSGNLTQHWERCVDMARNERWIWLFSDDDLMDENCVSMFRHALASTNSKYDVYRFNSRIINHDGAVVQNNTLHPPIEDACQFAISRLELQRNSYAVEYIFSKQKYISSGKFVSFPLAWSSDDATWINIGSDRGIFTIPDAFVYWRYSFTNISASQKLVKEKIEASLQYLVWLQKWIAVHCKSDKTIASRYEKARTTWLRHQLKLLNKKFTIGESYKLAIVFNQRISIPLPKSLLWFFDINFGSLKVKKQLATFIKKITK